MKCVCVFRSMYSANQSTDFTHPITTQSPPALASTLPTPCARPPSPTPLATPEATIATIAATSPPKSRLNAKAPVFVPASARRAVEQAIEAARQMQVQGHAQARCCNGWGSFCSCSNARPAAWGPSTTSSSRSPTATTRATAMPQQAYYHGQQARAF